MGRRALYSRQGILESLLEVYDSGIPLRVNDLKSAGKEGLLSAINRKKNISKQLVFFDGLKDARKQLAVYVSKEDPAKAELIRDFNKPPRREKYNRRAIKQGLLEHFDAGESLDGDSIKNTWMHNAIYYKWNGKFKTYGSLITAREDLATLLEKKNRFDDAARVRQYNQPPERKMPESERELRRKNLINQLYRKIEDGEDLGLRAQRKIDRTFANGCSYYFGTYSKIFSAADLKYQDFANRPLNKSREEYFIEFLDLIESEDTLQRAVFEKKYYNFMGRINKYENGYFQALGKARLYYSGKSDFDMVRYIDDFLVSDEKSPRDIISKENAKRREELKNSIRSYDKKMSYDVSALFPDVKERLSGIEIMRKAQASGEWLETVPFSKILHMERSNIKNLFHVYPDRILKFLFGKTQKYLFHKSIIDNRISRGEVFDNIVDRELDTIARSPTERSYFSKIIKPKLDIYIKDKPKLSTDEIKRAFYEFAGVRAIENYITSHIRDMPAKDKQIAVEGMQDLCRDYMRNNVENVFARLQEIVKRPS